MGVVGVWLSARVWDVRTGAPLFDLAGHKEAVNCVTFSPDGSRIVTGSGSLDRSVRVWDAGTGAALAELTGHAGAVTSVAFSPDGARLLTASEDRTAKVWDLRAGTPLLELHGHTDWVAEAAFAPDGSRVVTCSYDGTARVWDARPAGAEDTGELEYRLIHTRPDVWRYAREHRDARKADDAFAAAVHLDRWLSCEPSRISLYKIRDGLVADPRLTARAGFHHRELAATPYDRDIVHALAAAGDVLARRVVAQELMRAGRPDRAIPLLHLGLLTRPPASPPVDELLLAEAYRQPNRPDDARRVLAAATAWLDRPRAPMRIANVVSHAAVNGWAALGEAVKPVADPRRDPSDWEAWYECEVYRAKVESLLRGE
jgi:hypothetical protein